MSSSGPDERSRWLTTAEGVLRASAGLWFAAVVAGQAVFLYYIVAFYGGPTLSGDFAAWNVNPFLRKGYVAGDSPGNLAFAAHVLLAAVMVFSGALQLIPQIRTRAIAFHRWNGRIFLLAAMTTSLAGLYMVFVRGAGGGPVGSIALSLNAALILVFTALAWRAARARDIDLHRKWALRTFIVANGVFFIRMAVPAWFAITGGKVSSVAIFFFDFASYLLPLAILEFYLLTKESGGTLARLSAAGIVLMLTGYMSFGVFAFYMFVSKRILGAGG